MALGMLKKKRDSKMSTDQENENEQNGNQQNGNQQNGNGEDKEKQGGGPPKPVGFLDPRMKHVRRSVAGKWLLTTVVLMIFILGVLSICMLFPRGPMVSSYANRTLQTGRVSSTSTRTSPA